jgi:hypothetical protein
MRQRIPLVTSLTLLAVFLGVSTFLLVQSVVAKKHDPTIICRTSITAGLTDGPHAPLDLSGDVEMYVRSDLSFTGRLTLKQGGSHVAMKGQGAGHGVDIIFEPQGGKQLFAHGILEHSLYECSGNAGGPLVGPDYGDEGDWTNYPPFIRVISGTQR